MTSPIQHGGNQYAIRSRLKLNDRPLLDVSVSLNPFGPPRRAVEAAKRAMHLAGQYPEPGNPRLVHRIAEYHGVSPQNIFVGAGTSEIISLIGQGFRAPLQKMAAEHGDPEMPLSHLVEPIYAEYRRASSLNDLPMEIWSRDALAWSTDFFPDDAKGIYWTGNPVSPLGHVWDRKRLLARVDAAPDLTTVVDEAYLAFYHDEAERTVVRDAVSRSNLIVLRSVTKIFAMPGLRVGYAIASAPTVRKFREFQNPWSVDTASESALIAALDDEDYLERTIEVVGAQAPWLTDRLWEIPGIRPVWPGRVRPGDAPPPPNWVLVSLVDTPWTSIQLQEALARRGIYVRECSNFHGLEPGAVLQGDGQSVVTRGHLRFAVRDAAENEVVVRTLASLMNTSPYRGERSVGAAAWERAGRRAHFRAWIKRIAEGRKQRKACRK